MKKKAKGTRQSPFSQEAAARLTSQAARRADCEHAQAPPSIEEGRGFCIKRPSACMKVVIRLDLRIVENSPS